MQFLKRALLPTTVFVTGACVLILEVVATRILSPYFGNTIYSVSSVISVVLAALSAGYYFGGRLADKYPRKQVFFAIIAFSGVAVFCMQSLISGVLPSLSYTMPLTYGPLVMSCILFFLPSLILGMLSPFAIAIQQRDAKKGQGVGTTSGNIFFFSTLGSIAGSLLAGFVFIPYFGLQAIVLGVGAVLFLQGFVPLVVVKLDRKMLACLVAAAGSTLLLATTGMPTTKVLYSHDGVYEKILIGDGMYNGRPARFLQQDTSHSAAMYLDSDELAYPYSKYYVLYKLFTPKVDKALVLGGGAYSLPKALLAAEPKAEVDVSEIEPSLFQLSKKYFRLQDSPRLTNYTVDGRRMLHDTSNRYDLIFSDVYHSMYSIPAHFTTQEFMQLAHDRLTPNGVFMANLIGSTKQGDASFIWSEVKTMQQVFPQVYVYGVASPFEPGVQNIIVVGDMNPERHDMNDAALRENPDPTINSISSHYVATERISLARYPVLTDDYAPVDYLTAKVLPK